MRDSFKPSGFVARGADWCLPRLRVPLRQMPFEQFLNVGLLAKGDRSGLLVAGDLDPDEFVKVDTFARTPLADRCVEIIEDGLAG